MSTMDLGTTSGFGGFSEKEKKPRELPDDLPKSLDDRKRVPDLVQETELYDGWQGRCMVNSPSQASD